jgi:hypothetical protein
LSAVRCSGRSAGAEPETNPGAFSQRDHGLISFQL